MQFFDKNENAVYKPKSLEVNGHALIIRNTITSPNPVLVFDIKEVVLVPAVKGLPEKSVDLKAPYIGLISRFHQNLVIYIFIFK